MAEQKSRQSGSIIDPPFSKLLLDSLTADQQRQFLLRSYRLLNSENFIDEFTIEKIDTTHDVTTVDKLTDKSNI